jgi:hypothetical protein
LGLGSWLEIPKDKKQKSNKKQKQKSQTADPACLKF